MLRGCIGCLESLKLHPGLQDYTLKAGFQDNRFPPIKWHELSRAVLSFFVVVAAIGIV